MFFATYRPRTAQAGADLASPDPDPDLASPPKPCCKAENVFLKELLVISLRNPH